MTVAQQKMIDLLLEHPELEWRFSEEQPNKIVGQKSNTCTFATLHNEGYVKIGHFNGEDNSNIEYFYANDKNKRHNHELRAAILKACRLSE